MTVPVVLNVGGPFTVSHKYNNSVAMVLDSCEWYDAETGSVDVNGTYARLFKLDLTSTYRLIDSFMELSSDTTEFVRWSDIRQMIDILVDGQFWLVTTDSQGFVDANGFGDEEKAWDAYSLIEHEYMAASGDFEPCGVCGEYGHRVKEHDDDDQYVGPHFREYDQ